jgi:formylglycine-generating enzyme required for sulfatase activity
VTAKAVADAPETEAVQDNQSRLLRGGSFSDQPSFVRSAYRLANLPTVRNAYFGFRPSRTYP